MKVTALSSASDTTIYAQVDDLAAQGLYRSTDAGRSWQPIDTQLGRDVTALAIDPSDPRVLYAGASGGASGVRDGSLYLSHDSGQTWSKAPLSLPANSDRQVPTVSSLAVDSAEADVLFVGTDGQGVYKLTDGGTTMTALGNEFYGARVHQVVVTPDDSERLHAVTSQGLFESDNGGGSWKQVQTLPEQAVNLAIAPSDSRIMYAGTSSMGAYRSEDGGQTWQPIGEGLGLMPGVALSVTSLRVDAEDPYLVYATPSYILGTSEAHELPLGVHVSRDGGDSWHELTTQDSVGAVNALLQVPGQTGEVLLGTEQGVFRADQEQISTITTPADVPNALSAAQEGSMAFNKVLIILFTVMAATAVFVISPIKLCQGLLGRSAKTCDS
jgi:photosystem II stability/assembly factor-like uncharacterized protein